MPGELQHRTITAQALAANKVTDAEELSRDYCCYPDYYFGPRRSEVLPYMYFYDGIQFHYPPHTPVEEFYRYWDRDEKRNFLLRTRKNDNLIHVEAGFRFYLEKVISLLQKNDRNEALKFLGCLLHFLEDSTFGIHALEGADGTDIFVLDRLTGTNITKELAFMPMSEELKMLTVEPEILSDSVEETVALLYSRYVQGVNSSRIALFDMAMANIYGKGKKTVQENEKIMFLNALSLAADTIATVFAIADQNVPQTAKRRLNEFSPFLYPFGGGGGFVLRRYEEKENVFSFGINNDASLLFNIPKNVYSCLTAEITTEENNALTLQLINNGQCVQTIELEGPGVFPVMIKSPAGETGFKIISLNSGGKIHISNGIFLRAVPDNG